MTNLLKDCRTFIEEQEQALKEAAAIIADAVKLEQRLQAVEKERPNRPEIVCICGSSRFCDLAAVHAWNFEKMGKLALSMHLLPDWYWQATNKVGHDHGAEQEGVAHILDELHLRKIDLCDFVFVVNKGGYIGERTRIEIDYATYKGKRIEYLEPHAVDELEAELARFKEIHHQPDRVLQTTQPCRRCGKPGAVLHFPGGWLCSGGCGSDIL